MPCYFVHCSVCGRDGHNRRRHALTGVARTKRKRRWARASEQRRREKRRAAGLCWNCGFPSAPFKQCFMCRRKRAERKRR